jgi:alcohol dehydrogenase
LHEWGTFAEYVAVDVDFLAHVDVARMSMPEAAAVPLAGLTALQSVDFVASRQSGKHTKLKVLIHAGAGGVGTFLIQMAKAKNWEVWTTCSAGCELCKSLGADHVLDYKKKKFEDQLPNALFDAVFDSMGGEYLLRSMPLCKPEGAYVEIINSGWQTYWNTGVSPVVVAYMYGSLVYYTLKGWLGMGPSYLMLMVAAKGKQLAEIDAMIANNSVRVVVDRVLQSGSLETKAREMHTYLESNTAKGKVVMTIP